MNIPVVLKQADIFSGVSHEQLMRVASFCRVQDYEEGNIIFEENSTGKELFVIADGEVEILVNPALVSHLPDTQIKPQVIATMRRGQSFGEIALVDHGVRSAMARTSSSKAQLVIIPQDKLMNLCNEDPVLGFQLMYNLAQDLSTKLRGSDFQIRGHFLKVRDKKI
ncbi:MAG: cyclic nucleotide-binding domain-containing protein [Anaerolineales bacterium]|nr:cyclic nucleotide-binding domain-containing protein [Anaerolineales bacterium]